MSNGNNASGVASLGRHSLVYGIGTVLAAAGGFLLIPLYTQVLSTSQYGVLELLNRTADILLLVMFMGVRQAYIRFYFEDNSRRWRDTVTATTLVFVLASSATIAAVVYPLRGLFLDAFIPDGDGGRLVLLVLCWMPFELLVQVAMAYLQVRVRSWLYVGLNVLRLTAFICLNVLLIYVQDYGVAGVLMAQVTVTGFIGGGFLLFALRHTGLRFSWPLTKRLLAFGLPYLPATGFMYLINNSDRYFIGTFASLSALGTYALAHKIGMIGTRFLMEPFNKVWAPFMFQRYRDPDGPQVLGRVFTLYTLSCLFAALSVSLVAPIAIPLIAAPDYHEAHRLVPLISLASVFFGMAFLSDAGVLIAKKTAYKPLIFAVGASVAVLANFLLVPEYGVLGAAVAIVLAFFVLFVTNLTVSNRFYKLHIELLPLLVAFAAAVSLYLAGAYAMRQVDELWWRGLAAVCAAGAFPVFLWIAGIISIEEKRMVRQALRRVTRRAAVVAPAR